jgi:hypothetical protein
MSEPSQPKPSRKSSTVRHTRAIQVDRSKRPAGAPPDEQIEARLKELISPAIYAQLDAYRAMGLRHRLLTLPVMVAFVLSLIWRQLGSVSEAVRGLQTEGILWVEAFKVSQQAVSQRLATFPPSLFYQVLRDVLPVMQTRWLARARPLPPVVAWAQQHFSAVLVLDGSTLDALLKQTGLLRKTDGKPLGGRIAALLELGSHLPRQVWFEEDSQAHDQRFWERALAAVTAGALLLMDAGFLNFAIFDQLTAQGRFWLTRARSNTAYEAQTILQKTAQLHDAIVRLGKPKKRAKHPVRLVEVLYRGQWYRYLTNVLDPAVLSAEQVVALYGQRWRIEEAFLVVKRLLGLAYLWVGSLNGIQTQVWATWLLYAVLVDLTDDVANALQQPFATVSLEMVFRGLYHFTQAFHRGQATDPVAYLAANAKRLGLIKHKRRPPKQTISTLTDPSTP